VSERVFGRRPRPIFLDKFFYDVQRKKRKKEKGKGRMKRAKKGKRKKSERGREEDATSLCARTPLWILFFGDADARVHRVLAHAYTHARARARACNVQFQTARVSRVHSLFLRFTRVHARAHTGTHAERMDKSSRRFHRAHDLSSHRIRMHTREEYAYRFPHTRNPRSPRIRVHRRTCDTRATQDARARFPHSELRSSLRIWMSS